MAEQENILTKLHDLLLYVVPVLAERIRNAGAGPVVMRPSRTGTFLGKRNKIDLRTMPCCVRR